MMPQPRSEPSHARPSRRPHWGTWTLIGLLLIAVLAGTLWVPVYDRTTSALGGFPFFYWYQLLWVPVVALISWCAYLLSRRAQRGTAASVAAPPAAPLSSPPAGGVTDGSGPAEPGHQTPAQRDATTPASAPPLPKRQVPPRKEGS